MFLDLATNYQLETKPIYQTIFLGVKISNLKPNNTLEQQKLDLLHPQYT